MKTSTCHRCGQKHKKKIYSKSVLEGWGEGPGHWRTFYKLPCSHLFEECQVLILGLTESRFFPILSSEAPSNRLCSFSTPLTPQCPSHLQYRFKIITLASPYLCGSRHLTRSPFSFFFYCHPLPLISEDLDTYITFLITLRCNLNMHVNYQPYILDPHILNFISCYGFDRHSIRASVTITISISLSSNDQKLSISENIKLKHLTFWMLTPIPFSASFFSQFIRPFPTYLYTMISHLKTL